MKFIFQENRAGSFPPSDTVLGPSFNEERYGWDVWNAGHCLGSPGTEIHVAYNLVYISVCITLIGLRSIHVNGTRRLCPLSGNTIEGAATPRRSDASRCGGAKPQDRGREKEP